MGRVVAKPHVKTDEDPYAKPLFPPCLEWFELYRGCDPAGELLAAFELLQVSHRIKYSPLNLKMSLAVSNPNFTDHGKCE